MAPRGETYEASTRLKLFADGNDALGRDNCIVAGGPACKAYRSCRKGVVEIGVEGRIQSGTMG